MDANRNKLPAGFAELYTTFLSVFYQKGVLNEDLLSKKEFTFSY